MQRFLRTRLLLGESRFDRLRASHVAVIGLGAVGSYAVEGLARAGVGKLTLMDFDTIQPTNINRQLIALDSTIGQPKVQAARDRIIDINPDCRVVPHELFGDSDSIEQVLATGPDVLIDAIDSLNPKVQVLTASFHSPVKLFSSMGAALRTDPAQVRIGDISETRNCPLAKKIRKRLRRQGIESGITCVYSTEPVDFDYANSGESQPEDRVVDRGRERNTLGSLPTLTGMFGLLLAHETIIHLCG